MKLFKKYILEFTLVVVLLSIVSCRPYHQTTKETSGTKFWYDTIYNPPGLPDAERIIYGGGTAVNTGVSRPVREIAQDSISKQSNDSQEIYEIQNNKRDSLQKIDTTKKNQNSRYRTR